MGEADAGGGDRAGVGSGWIAEPRVPVRAVAERLVLRRAAAAQRVVLRGGTLPELHAHELDAAGDRVRPVVGPGDHRRAVRRLGLDAVDRVAERPRRALPDRRDDLLHPGAVRSDPRLVVHAEHRLQPVGAEPRVRADRAVVENRDALAGIALAPVLARIRGVRVLEADHAVRSVTEGLVLRGAAAAQRDRAYVRANLARSTAQVRHRPDFHVVQEVVGTVRRAAELRFGVHGRHVTRLGYSGVLTICPDAVTNHFSFGQVFPARLAAIQSATWTAGVGPTVAPGTPRTDGRGSWYTTQRFGPFSVFMSRSVCSSGESSSCSPAMHRYGTRTRSACPSQVMVFLNSSNLASSVNPDMNMKRILKVGEASSKIV